MKEPILSGKRPGNPPSQLHSVMEGFIDDYGRIRLVVAVASIGLLAGLTIANGPSWTLAINGLGLLIMAIHAAWCLVGGVRTPRLALVLDMTVLGATATVSISATAAAVSWTFWMVLITFLTYGRSRGFFYAYASFWYLFLVSRSEPPQTLDLTFSIVFMVSIITVILLAINRRMMTLDIQRSQLLGSVSHELRNQLTGVIGMIELASNEEAGLAAEEMRDFIGLARREALDALDVIEDLLTSSRMDNGALDMSLERFDIGLEVGRLVEHYPLEGGASVVQIGAKTGVTAHADPVRLRQILRNLLSNTMRYGGKSIEVGIEHDAKSVRIRVVDDGPGVPPGEEESIFQPFRRAANTPRHRNSVGLGLWTSRRLARAMGGDLAYRREDDRTVFELSLAHHAPPVPKDEASLTKTS